MKYAGLQLSFLVVVLASSSACKNATPEKAQAAAKAYAAQPGEDGEAEADPAGGAEPAEPLDPDEEELALHNDNQLGAAIPIGDEQVSEISEAEREVLKRLREQAGRLDRDKLELAQKEADLRRVELELQSRLDKIGQLEDRLQRELGIGKAAQDRRDERINALSELVMTMPPQSGAEMLSQMTDYDAQSILLSISRKNGRKAAKVLSQMPADRAATLSQLYLNLDQKLAGTDDIVPETPVPSTATPDQGGANPATPDAPAADAPTGDGK